MRLQKRSDGWWITDVPEGIDEMGPYSNRWDAEEDLEGLARYETLKPHEISCDSPLAKKRA